MTKILVAFYTTYGTNHQIAEAAAEAARAAGAEVRLRRFAETAPMQVVEAQAPWKAQLDRMADIEVIAQDDLLWADGIFFSVPTRYSNMPSQVEAFIDTLGGIWSQGKLADKAITATATASSMQGGQTLTIQSVYSMAIHWGSIIVAPGYTSDATNAAGGSPYGYAGIGGQFDDAGRTAVTHQATRLVAFAGRLAGRPAD